MQIKNLRMQVLSFSALLLVLFWVATPKIQPTSDKPNTEIWDTTTVLILVKTADTVFPEPPPRASLYNKLIEQVIIKPSHHKGAVFRKETQKHIKKFEYKDCETIPTAYKTVKDSIATKIDCKGKTFYTKFKKQVRIREKSSKCYTVPTEYNILDHYILIKDGTENEIIPAEYTTAETYRANNYCPQRMVIPVEYKIFKIMKCRDK